MTGGFVLLLTIVLVLLAALWGQHTDKMYDNHLESNYGYEISITGSSELQNATFYLPVPVFENESEKGLAFVEKDFYGRPPDWNFSIEETEHGPMLKIEAEKIQPVFHSLPVAISESEVIEEEVMEEEMGPEPPAPRHFKESDEYSEEFPVLISFYFEDYQEASKPINTRNPVGNEFLLLPKYDLKESEKGSIAPNSKHIGPRYYDYESRVYASYESSSETIVEIYVCFGGSNEWWIYGWKGNSYDDWLSVRLTGPQEGWTPAEGELITADGVYRN